MNIDQLLSRVDSYGSSAISWSLGIYAWWRSLQASTWWLKIQQPGTYSVHSNMNRRGATGCPFWLLFLVVTITVIQPCFLCDGSYEKLMYRWLLLLSLPCDTCGFSGPLGQLLGGCVNLGQFSLRLDAMQDGNYRPEAAAGWQLAGGFKHFSIGDFTDL